MFVLVEDTAVSSGIHHPDKLDKFYFKRQYNNYIKLNTVWYTHQYLLIRQHIKKHKYMNNKCS
jgi:hypothetical protein